ncbi:MAG: hypothetical protein C5B52_14510 [Bacteroidetes bacterium]|nr:MAG: hypothetical protein C5B52_14510 [Bacteroidota bacterium]
MNTKITVPIEGRRHNKYLTGLFSSIEFFWLHSGEFYPLKILMPYLIDSLVVLARFITFLKIMARFFVTIRVMTRPEKFINPK